MRRFALLFLAVFANAKELSVVDWQQIRAEYERQRHRIFPAKSGWSALSASQQWITKFDGRGFTISPNNETWKWGLEFAGDNSTVTTNGNRITYHWSADLEEWFINDPRGLEHGFTLAKPQDIVLKVRGGLRGRGQGESIEFVDGNDTARIRYSELRAWDANRKPVPATMHATGDRVKITLDDRSATYPVTIDPIAQQAYLKASNTGSFDNFGSSIAVSGDTVAVGAPAESSNATGVNGNQADNSAAGSGAVYIFKKSAGVWSQQAYLKASNTDAGDAFSTSLAMLGDTLVVGSPGESSSSTGVNGNQANNSSTSSGAAYVFVRNGTAWIQQAYLKASNTNALDDFGRSAAIEADTILIGASNQNTTGAAYVFVRSGATWSQQALLTASNARTYDLFGWAVSISGNSALITAPGEDSASTGVNGNQNIYAKVESGAAYVFVRTGSVWSQEAFLKASNTDHFDQFGKSGSIAGDTIAIGAIQEASNGNQIGNDIEVSGAVYVFQRTGNTWVQIAFLKAPVPRASEQFGQQVALSGDTLVVGTRLYGSSQQSTPASAYILRRTGTTWVHQTALQASNAMAFDRFGYAVAIGGELIAAGSPHEHSNATGINGNQADTSAQQAGAAYIFTGVTSTANIASDPYGAAFTVTGTGCEPGSYTTFKTLAWTPGVDCTLTVTSPQTLLSAPHYFRRWEDNSTNTTRTIRAGTSQATYRATFLLTPQPTATPSPTGLSQPGQGSSQTIYVTAEDADGAGDIARISFKIANSASDTANVCSGYFDTETQSFYLYDDAGTNVMGPFIWNVTAGVSNSQCGLASAGSLYFFRQLTTATLSIGINLYSPFNATSKFIYVRVRDYQGQEGPWTQSAIWSQTPSAQAILVTPAPNTVLSSSSANFTWTNAISGGPYWLDVGTSVGAGNISAGSTTVTNRSVSGLPTDGRTIYVRLWTSANGAWLTPIDYTLAACNGCAATGAQLQSHTPGVSMLAGATDTFFWTAVAGATKYSLDVGTTLGASDIHSGETPLTIKDVSNLPVDSSKVHLRIRAYVNNTWSAPSDFAIDACPPQCGAQTVSIRTPHQGSTFNSTSVTFTWTAPAHITSVDLRIGSSKGSSQYFSGTTTARSLRVNGLPNDGSQIYVMAYPTGSGNPYYYSYTACTGCSDNGMHLQSPVPGASLTSTNPTFTWSAAANATKYLLEIGTALGTANISSGETTTTSRTPTNLPINGTTLFVRLHPFINGTWGPPKDYLYIACVNCSASVSAATLTAPAQGATLTASSVNFTWNAVASATNYWLDVGSAKGMGEISAGATTNTSKQVANLPTNGQTIHVRLWTFLNGAWQTPNDYTFTACTGCTSTTPGALATPAPGSTLTGSSVTFTWNALTGATNYWLDVGTSVGKGDISAGATTATSKQVTNLPIDGRTIHARLWTYFNGTWQAPRDYTFTACTGCANTNTATLTAPAQGATLASSSVTFTWTAAPGATNYWLDVGYSKGSGDISAGASAATSKQVNTIPTAGQTIHVRLWTFVNSAWQTPNDYTFTACTGCAETRAVLSNPTIGSAFTTRTVTFGWWPAAGATQYWLDVGTVQGQGNIFGGAMTTLAKQVTNLPANGAPIYVALWTFRNGAWETPLNYTFTACNNCPAENRALLTAPAIGSTLTAGTVNFTWSAGSGATQYWLDVGNSVGLGDIAARNVTTTSTTVTVPRDGRTISIRLWTFVNGAWQPPFDYVVKACSGC